MKKADKRFEESQSALAQAESMHATYTATIARQQEIIDSIKSKPIHTKLLEWLHGEIQQQDGRVLNFYGDGFLEGMKWVKEKLVELTK